MRKILSFILVLVLLMSSTVTMAAPRKGVEIDLTDFEEVNMLPEKAKEINFVDTLDDENDYVRVVVQLKDEPAISKVGRSVKKYAELSESTKDNLESKVLNSQTSLQSELSKKGIDVDIINSMTVATNAFSTKVRGDEIEKIQDNPNVKGVFIANEYSRPETPEMTTSHDIIGSYYAWDTRGYKGENMVVAIVDSGLDPSHKDMKISDGVNVKLNQKIVNPLNLPGTYRTKKVPYGYNYFDNNQNILDVDYRSHGMHVAGTVGANGYIKGVAPEAQLLAMKVFSNDPDFPSTYDDIYMKAIDDAIKLGADVINLSLGGPASFYTPNNAMDEMVTNAREHGVVFAMAAGNEGFSTSGFSKNYGLPFEENIDIGMVGSPSVTKDSISVASIENTHHQINCIKYGENKIAPYSLADPIPLTDKFTKPLEYVFVGFGHQEDFEGKDLNGKVALISRGEATFTDKIINAENAGAAAAIVFNNVDNELINMAYPDGGKIPAVFIGKSYGVELVDLENKFVSFPKELFKVENPTSWEMSDFSSWGTTPTLDIKPEITAPGGKIFSTLESDKYGTMNGTSMASPHVAGGAALVLQYLKDKFTNMRTEQISEFSKIILMNTAIPVVDSDGELYSPRRQGAGLMNLPGALTTPATVVNKNDGEAKVQLRELTSEEFDINLLVTNHSNDSVEYDIEVDVLADYIYSGLNLMGSESIEGVKIRGDNSVRLDAGETKEVSITVDISEGVVPGLGTSITENMFIEGFVRFISPIEEAVDGVEEELYPPLVVPYVGFYGDWYGENSPRILDGMEYFGEKSYYGFAGMINQKGAYMGYHPVTGYKNSIDRLAISPDSTAEEVNTHINPILSFMRNAEEVQFNILDGSGRQIRKIKTENWVRKQYANLQDIWYSYTPSRAWDGKVNNQVVEDGQYFYEIKARPQNGEFQVYKFPVYVDTVAPEILNLKYEKGKLSWEASDKGIGLSHFVLYVGDEEKGAFASNVRGKYEVEINVPEKTDIKLIAKDYAGNISEVGTKSSLGQKPTMTFETPKPFDLLNKNSIYIKGSIKAEEGLKSLIAYIIPDGKEDDKIEVNITVGEDGKFSQLVENLEDALYTIRLVATDKSEQQYEIFRYFSVDTTAPVIKDIKVNLKDSDGEVIDKKMPGGGTIIIIPHLNEAFHKDYIEKNTIARNKFNQAIASGKDIYVKLSEDVFVNYNGEPATQNDVPALTYYNAQGFTEKYDKNGKFIPTAVKTAKFTMKVEENHGYFEVYINGSQEYIQSKYGTIERKPFTGTIEFSAEMLDNINEIELIIKDSAENQVTKNVNLQSK